MSEENVKMAPSSTPMPGSELLTQDDLSMASPAQLRAMAKTLLKVAATPLASRSRFIDNVDGMTFRGRRNLYKALGYERRIWYDQYRSRYRRNAVAHRLVEAKPKATWRGGAELIEDDQNVLELTKFESAWDRLEKRLNIWATFLRADILAGLGRYSVILLGSPGDLDQPATKMRPDELVYLTPFTEEDAQVEKFDTDLRSPRFGLPIYYAIRRLTPNALLVNSPETVGRRVHHTRIIHVADGLLDDHVYGIPRLECVWNLLDDLEKITGGGAEAFWKRADQGIHLDLDPMLQVSDDDLDKLKKQIDDYEHNLKRVLTTRGVKVKTVGSDVADIGPSVGAIMDLIAAGSEIPQRILMGSEAAKLASSQDADMWDERVMDRRNEWAGPHVVRPFVQRLIDLGILPEPKQFDVRWPEMYNLNEFQKADIANKWSTINKNTGQNVVTGEEIRDRVLGLPTAHPAKDAPKPGVGSYPSEPIQRDFPRTMRGRRGYTRWVKRGRS